VKGILEGDPVVLSRAITLAESQQPQHEETIRKVLEEIMPRSGRSFRMAVTGVPGVGKSTFIESFGKLLVEKGHKLAVLAIDPSSNKSGGSILGDKTRMEKLSGMKNVFIRPSPSGGTLGGVTRVTYETILLCEAAGFDFIMVETVGVGQSEISVSRITDFFLLLMLAGAGDELQGIKKGIMEMADAIVITKAEGENLKKAKAARGDYAQALHFQQTPESGWIPKVMMCSSVENTGLHDVLKMIDSYRQLVTANGYLDNHRKEQAFEIFIGILEDRLKKKFFSHPGIEKELISLAGKSIPQPFSKAEELLKKLGL
jgi:LAO/AO transport system kinase